MINKENIVILGLCLCFWFVVMIAIGSCIGKNVIWDCAVKQGVAEYVCDDDGCRFEWKDQLDE